MPPQGNIIRFDIERRRLATIDKALVDMRGAVGRLERAAARLTSQNSIRHTWNVKALFCRYLITKNWASFVDVTGIVDRLTSTIEAKDDEIARLQADLERLRTQLISLQQTIKADQDLKLEQKINTDGDTELNNGIGSDLDVDSDHDSMLEMSIKREEDLDFDQLFNNDQ